MSAKSFQTFNARRLDAPGSKLFYLLVLVFIFLSVGTATAQRTIHGLVTGKDDGQPLPGVTVLITGKNQGTQTDATGHYKIAAATDAKSLDFKFVGYKTQKVAIGTSDEINVALEASDRSLSEVVVVGYGTQKRRDVTGAVATVQVRGNRQAAAQVQANSNAEITVNEPVGNAAVAASQQYQQPAPGDYSVFMRKSAVMADNNESYDRIVENKFIDPKAEPLSTFSADVDAASYTNVRRFINSGQLPPKNAVRIEEMINYFNYNLPGPKDGKPVAITTELSAAPWNLQHQLVRIGLKAKDVEKSKLPPSNLVFLIDVSGSMFEPNKLPLVKASLKMLVDQLREKDHVAIVVYAGNAGLVLPSTAGSDKQKIKEAIDQLEAGGSTAGGAGIKLAYKIARENFIKGGNNRVILSTDGDFNVGASSDKDMEQLIEEERGDGISISILGFGMGNYKDSKMEKIADKGHGNYAYIDNITEATKSMVTEFGGTLFTVAKDVKLQVEFNPAKVAAYRLLGYEDRLMAKEDFNNDAKLGGDMGVGHVVTALYEVIPVGVKDNFSNSVDPLKYQPTQATSIKNASDEIATVKFRYKEPDGEVSKLESVVVVDKPEAAAKTSNDFKFAAAVAEYGLLLRNSQYKQHADFDQLISMAKAAKGEDENGYRAEFIRMAESTKNLMKSKAVVVADKSK